MRKVGCFFAGIYFLCTLAVAQVQTYGQPIKWNGYMSGIHSRVSKEGTFVIQNFNEWQRFWAQLMGPSPLTPQQDVDFNSQMIVAVALGKRPDGTRVYINHIQRTSAGEITISYTEALSGSSTRNSGNTRPYDIIRMDRQAGRFSFSKEVSQASMNGGHADMRAAGFDEMWEPYVSYSSCLITKPKMVVIRNQQDLDSYWEQLTGVPKSPQDVNWNNSELVAIHLGSRSTAGHRVVIDSVRRTESRGLVIRYHETTPTPEEMATSANLNPFVVLKVAKAPGGVVFQKSE